MTDGGLPDPIPPNTEGGMAVGAQIDRLGLAATGGSLLGHAQDGAHPATEPRDDVLDLAILDDVTDLLGPAKLLTTLQRFAIELETRLLAGSVGADGRVGFSRDAHVVASMAGLLGFTDLSRRCTALLKLRPDDSDFAAAAAAIVAAKLAAGRRLVALIAGMGSRAPVA